MPMGDPLPWWARAQVRPIQFYDNPPAKYAPNGPKPDMTAKANPNRFRLLQAVFILSPMQEGKIVAVNYVAEGDVEVLVRFPGGSGILAAERVFSGNELEWISDEYGERWLAP